MIEQNEEAEELQEKKNPFPEELITELNYQLDTVSNKDSLLKRFYISKRQFVWFNSKLELNKDGEKIIELLKASKTYGVDTIHYQLSELEHYLNNNIIKAELLLTLNYAKFGEYISQGQITRVSDYYNFDRRRVDTNWFSILNVGVENNSIIRELLSLQPKNNEYFRLQKALNLYLNRVTLSDSAIKIKDRKKDSIKTYQLARKALMLHGFLSNDSVSDTLLIKGIKDFQYEHGLTVDGLIGRGTAKELSRSTNYFYNQAKVALEKWRWTKDFELEHIFVNIATYKLKCYKNGKVNYETKVVVGTNITRTPELDSKLDYMIAYPYWHVPRSIIEGELVLKAKKDSTYLARNGYEVFKNKQVVNSKAIDWSKGSNFKIRQKGGGYNALGKIKFKFPNRSSIYFHDTPSKRFFKKGRRAYSHGCIRVYKPLDLAGYFLENDSVNKYSIDTVRHFVENKTRKVISFNKKVPVYIRYYTVEADSSFNIRFYPDVYSKEEELLKYRF